MNKLKYGKFTEEEDREFRKDMEIYDIPPQDVIDEYNEEWFKDVKRIAKLKANEGKNHMGVINKIKSWIFEKEEENKNNTNEKIISENEIKKEETIEKIKLKDMENIIHCCNLLKQGNVVIFSLEEMKEERQRFLDFISGALLATDGIIKKLNDDIIVCIPKNIKLLEENYINN